jgi:hypothetical protein
VEDKFESNKIGSREVSCDFIAAVEVRNCQSVPKLKKIHRTEKISRSEGAQRVKIDSLDLGPKGEMEDILAYVVRIEFTKEL